MTEPLKPIPATTDMEVAVALKKRTLAALQPVLEVMAEARKQGFELSWGVGPGPMSNYVVTVLKVVKEF